MTKDSLPPSPRSAVVRERSFAVFTDHPPTQQSPNRRAFMRAQNFVVERVESLGQTFEVESGAELLLILPDTDATVSHAVAGTLASARKGSVCILAAGRYSVAVAAGGTCVVLASDRPDLDLSAALNAAAYAEPDARIKPTGQPYARNASGKPGAPAMQVFDMAAVQAPADNPRLKMLQTETLSINWVEYTGARDRTALSPHSHADLEQGSLALAGNYVHHLRTAWGKNADLWRDDEHLPAPSPSLLVVPVDLIHTTEGVGGGHHLLIDVFSPPRADFIAKGWVHNADMYTACTARNTGP